MKSLVFATFLMGFLCLFSCENGSSSSSSDFESAGVVDYSRSEREIKDDLKTRESLSPLRYLSTEGTYRKNLLGEMVLEGEVSNSATLAGFKDIQIRIVGYSKTESVVKEWGHTIYEYVKPGRSKSFKVKITMPRSVKSVGWEIVDAVALN